MDRWRSPVRQSPSRSSLATGQLSIRSVTLLQGHGSCGLQGSRLVMGLQGRGGVARDTSPPRPTRDPATCASGRGTAGCAAARRPLPRRRRGEAPRRPSFVRARLGWRAVLARASARAVSAAGVGDGMSGRACAGSFSCATCAPPRRRTTSDQRGRGCENATEVISSGRRPPMRRTSK